MIRVLYFESSLGTGGSFESLYQHLSAIDRARLHPVVACLNPSRYVRLIDELGVPVHVLADRLYGGGSPPLARRAISAARRRVLWLDRHFPGVYVRFASWLHGPAIEALADIARRERIDVVHLNVQINRDLLGVIAAQRAGVHCASHLRSGDPRARHEFTSSVAAFANAGVATFVANSHMTADYWIDAGIDPGKTRVVYNGIGEDETLPLDVRRTWSLGGEDAPVVACVAPLRNRLKVDEFVVRGFARLLLRKPSATLLVVGDGPMREVLVQESRALGVEGRVVFTGFQERAKEIIADADASVIASPYDSFSRVALETMQAGTPLVATDVGGIREIVEDGQNGLLVPYGDEQAFADALERVLDDAGLSSTLAEGGRRTVRDRFSIERYVGAVEQVYQELVGQEAPAAGVPDVRL